ncbi:MAG: DnaJ domain-containing protein, partial [Desulfobaccales bacterium]
KAMTIKEARDCLGLEDAASRQEIIQAYRRAARRWHPDRAPEGREAEYRAIMQQVNAAYQRLKEFMESYRFPLEDTETGEDVEEWWQERFYTGVWGRPPQGKKSQDTAAEVDDDGAEADKKKKRVRD